MTRNSRSHTDREGIGALKEWSANTQETTEENTNEKGEIEDGTRLRPPSHTLTAKLIVNSRQNVST
jgi:hypothetical protein